MGPSSGLKLGWPTRLAEGEALLGPEDLIDDLGGIGGAALFDLELHRDAPRFHFQAYEGRTVLLRGAQPGGEFGGGLCGIRGQGEQCKGDECVESLHGIQWFNLAAPGLE